MHRHGLLLLVLGGLASCAAAPSSPPMPVAASSHTWTYQVRITGPDQAVWLEGEVGVPPDQGIEVTVKQPHCGQVGTTPAIALRLTPQVLPVFHLWLAIGDAQGRCAVVDQVMELSPGQVAQLPVPVSMGVHAQISRPGPPVIPSREPYLTPPSPRTILGRAALTAPP